ncbi:Rhomboid-like protein [Drosera capensis]
MNAGPSGFINGPVSRAFIIASVVFSIVFGVQGKSNKLGLSFQVFVVFSIIASLVLEVAALALFKDPSRNLITSGPYGFIFSSFVQFYFDIPVSSRFKIFRFRLSDKSFIYFAGLQQLFLSSRRGSLLPGICGILAGFLYHMNVFYIRKIKFPPHVASLFSRFFGPSTPRTSSPAASRNILRNFPAHSGPQLERNIPAPMAAVVLPPEESVAMLVSMGFDENAARQALLQARNDINVATNILLEASSR